MGRRVASEFLSCFRLCQKWQRESYGREHDRHSFTTMESVSGAKVDGGNIGVRTLVGDHQTEVVVVQNCQLWVK